MSKNQTRIRVYVLLALIVGAALFTYVYFFQPFAEFGFAVDPTKPPAKIKQPTGSATVYQALYVIYRDGASKWYYAPKRMTSLVIIDPAYGIQLSNRVTSIQTHVFMCVNYDNAKTVQAWSFSATGNFKIADANLNVLRDFGGIPISASGSTLQDNVDVWVTSASMTAVDVEQLYSFETYPTRYALVISIKNIQVTVRYTDGTSETINVLSGSENNLVWRFYIQPAVYAP